MARRINGDLYCVKGYSGGRHYVEAESEEDLFRYIAQWVKKGNILTSVTKMCADGSTPKVTVLTDKRYKAIWNELSDRR